MNLLITGVWSDAKNNIESIEQMGHSVEFMQFEMDELPCEYEWIEGVICNGLFLHHDISKFVNLKYIQLTSAGFDRVPMEYVREHNINIYNARGVYSIPMAEYAIAGVLQLYKQMRFFADNQKNKVWEKHRGLLELSGKKVCIIGCGSVGTECAKRFKAFGCEVVGVELYPRDDESYNSMVHLLEIDEVLKSVDVVVLTVPLTEETEHLMNCDRLEKLKETAIIVNIARGGIVNTEGLINVLPHIGGAVLDVFEDEPIGEESPLWDMENVIITPHNSFVGDGNDNRLSKMIFNNLIRG